MNKIAKIDETVEPGRGPMSESRQAATMTDTAAEGIVRALLKAWHDGGAGAIATGLDELASLTRHGAFRRAAQVVRGRGAGRPEIDDREALRRVLGYPPHLRHEAVGRVALAMAEGDKREERRMSHRLYEKLRKAPEK
jgi:hypothetical protein